MERLPLEKRLGLGAILIGLAILVFMFIQAKPTVGGGSVPDIPPLPLTQTGGGQVYMMKGGGDLGQTFFDVDFDEIVDEIKKLGFSS